MEAIATTTPQPNQGVEDNIATNILTVRRALEDIQDASRNGKGKNRVGEELALQTHVRGLEAWLEVLNDRRFALSLDGAVQADQEQILSLSVLEQAEHDDREAALALSRGEDIPPPTIFQRLLDNNFSVNLNTGHSTGDDAEESLYFADSSDDDSIKPPAVPKFKQPVYEPSPSAPQAGPCSRKECFICGDAIMNISNSYRSPCDHYYCRGCLMDLVETATRDESLYPLCCCRQNLSIEEINPLLDLELRVRFRQKSAEFSIPAASRVYCTRQTCSAFLGAATNQRRKDIVCPHCGTPVCSGCKNEAHPSEDCAESKATLEVKALAADRRWQTCPGCHSIVELSQGCYHMTCRCSTQFCYLCAARWKQCTCPQWDEARLVNETGRRRRWY
ncbi:hypothetical protein SERLA73DRAFT_109940 [Serpula lacrymans var. lacrymans S7.3]|uniref:RBR-type E3 ubiquitin transferase n=1 Tax=Serpula lacrymans var. lacrymans (strain S7.3) TaxID=936435 RepID=F8PZX5_SERL3|nr:hypothetical protein SERLA73DRAFT_109940 [Serpula lacrymans var. lacrymans S7.3]